MMVKRIAIFLSFALVLLLAAGCDTSMPTMVKIRDSKLLDRRIKETPRQQTMRECTQEANRFHVSCTHCHTTDKSDAITLENPALTEKGVKAQIMRMSPTFGLHQDCNQS